MEEEVATIVMEETRGGGGEADCNGCSDSEDKPIIVTDGERMEIY